MENLKNIILGFFNNIVRVFKLAWEIDAKLVALYYFTAAFGAISPIIVALLFKVLLDKIVTNGSLPVQQNSIPLIIIYVLAGYFIMKLVEAVIYWGLNVNYFDRLLQNKMSIGLDRRYVGKLSTMDLEHLENPEIQNLITRVGHTYMQHVPSFVVRWNHLFHDLIGIFSIFIALAVYNIWIPLIVLVVSLPRVYFKLKLGKNVYSIYTASNPETRKMWYLIDLLIETPSIIETRIFQSQKALIGRLSKLQDSIFETTKKPLDTYRLTLIIAPIIEIIVAFFLVYRLLPSGLSGALTIGSISFIIMGMEQLRSGIVWATANSGELYANNLFINPFYELMALPKCIKEISTPKLLKGKIPPRIEFKNVSFTYPNGKKVLDDISFTIEPGESIALVGVNGAGKTTMIKLLCRFYDVSGGEILIDGINIKELSLSNWYSHLGTLFQDFVKYKFTIKDSIMMGAPHIKDKKRMHEAAVNSGAYPFIKAFDRGYDQMVGKGFEDGQELSGGQWQKLAIARALYQRAPVLIMDEPTSAIDAEAEYQIFQNLAQVYKDNTLILVSHRFSTVRNASKIVVIDNGKIIEMGNHSELLDLNGKYALMFNTQAKGYQ